MRIASHPILNDEDQKFVPITVNGVVIKAVEGESIAAALAANGIMTHRLTPKLGEPRGIYCAIGRCTDCMMIVNGRPNVRTCITPVKEGMQINTQNGKGD